LEGYVKSLEGFNGRSWGEVNTIGLVSARKLMLAIPGNAAQWQLDEIGRIKQWAQGLGVNVTTEVIP